VPGTYLKDRLQKKKKKKKERGGGGAFRGVEGSEILFIRRKHWGMMTRRETGSEGRL